jgi:hypothetical protein
VQDRGPCGTVDRPGLDRTVFNSLVLTEAKVIFICFLSKEKCDITSSRSENAIFLLSPAGIYCLCTSIHRTHAKKRLRAITLKKKIHAKKNKKLRKPKIVF